MMVYHNTFVMKAPARQAAMEMNGHTREGLPRKVFNNIFYHLDRMPGFTAANPEHQCVCDGNLYWSPMATDKVRDTLFTKFRKSPQFAQSQKLYPAGSTTNSLAADPLFVRVQGDFTADNDYRLQAKSAAINAGAAIPDEWPDPLRKSDAGRPDIGAFPAGAEELKAGR
jgi:hypothetical protein